MKVLHKAFVNHHLVRMEEITRDVCRDFEAELVEINGDNNHVHLLVNCRPKVAIAKLVNSLRGVSSRRMRQEFPDLVRHYCRANKLSSGSYSADCVGGALARISVAPRFVRKLRSRGAQLPPNP